ncbi:MAG: insulinase family protein, partial [Myxococcota bacterium]
DNLVVVRRNKGEFKPPKIAKPKITPVAIDPSRKSAFATTVEAMNIRPLEPEWLVEGSHYTRHQLPSGEMIAVANRRNQLFAIEYVIETGMRRDKLLCFALDLMEQSGTAEISAQALQRQLYALGTTISADCGLDWTRIQISGIDRNMDASVALLRAWLAGAALERATFDKLLANEMSRRKDAMDDPAAISRALGQYAAFGADSEYLLAAPSKLLAKADLDALRGLLRDLPNHRHRVLYFGPRSAAAVGPAVVIGRNHRPARAHPAPSYRQLSASRIFFTHRDVAQSTLLLNAPQPPLAQDEVALSRVYSEFMGGGLGAVIGQEIREARGLAYRAFAAHRYGQRPSDPSVVFGVLGTQSDKTVEALGTMLDLLRDPPVQAERLATAQQSILVDYRSSRIDPRRIAEWVHNWDQRGLPGDPEDEQARWIEAT